MVNDAACFGLQPVFNADEYPVRSLVCDGPRKIVVEENFDDRDGGWTKVAPKAAAQDRDPVFNSRR